MSIEILKKLKVKELLQRAELLGIQKPSKKKDELLAQVLQAEESSRESQEIAADRADSMEEKNEEKKGGDRHVCGCLDIMSDGYGFLRWQENNYLQSDTDVYVSQSQIRRYGLKKGHMVSGICKPNRQRDKYSALVKISQVNGYDPQELKGLCKFEKLIPHFPEERFVTDQPSENVAGRMISLFTPVGKGQRGLIVAAPKTGKTVLLQKIANTILRYNKAYMIMLLVDERPEEVTDMKENLLPDNSEVVASTFDEKTSNHIKVAEMVIEKAKRMVELGEDVIIMLDSITRLARAYNNEIPSSGKTLSGGIDVGALHYPKKFFGAARNIRGCGSLTILATALVDTGSKMDQVIFEEFKGTGNMELNLDRSLADARIYPAIDLVKSGTRREELLLTDTEKNKTYVIRKYLAASGSSYKGLQTIMKNIEATRDNEEFLNKMNG